jgi:hypothetical protein
MSIKELPMNHAAKLTIGAAMLALPLSLFAQDSSAQNASTQNMMVPAQGSLVQTLDAKKTTDGAEFKVKLDKSVRLGNGTVLPAGSLLVGKVAQDDMQVNGQAKLVLRFTQATLKSGQNVPIRATIVGLSSTSDDGSISWKPGTQKVDQVGVAANVDLHSNVASKNSGVFVSTKKDDVKIVAGTEIQVAVAPDVQAPDLTRTTGN